MPPDGEQPSNTVTYQPVVQATPTPPNPAREQPTEQLQELTEKLKAAADIMEESKATDGARWAEAKDEFQRLGKAIEVEREARETAEREKETADAIANMKALLQQVRAPSKAAYIGGNLSAQMAEMHPQGEFLGALVATGARDYEAQQWGKAKLRELGTRFATPDELYGKGQYGGVIGKATLGSTDATGGYIIPNNIVDQFLRPALYKNKFRQILTNVDGVTTAGVDIPFRNEETNTTTRATVAAFGTTKENVNLVYDGYTATMYTLARIYDLGKQFVRQSQGAAEQDVMTELGDSFARGEGYYVLRGSGSSEPYGLLTALDAAADRYDVTFTAAATLAGSIATAIATAAGDLAGRNVDDGLSAIMDPSEYWLMLRQGTDEAGFFFNPSEGPAAIRGIAAGVLVSPFGIPVYPDINMEDVHMIVGAFGKLKVYHGEGFRIDTSTEANTRWDQNLIGFHTEPGSTATYLQ